MLKLVAFIFAFAPLTALAAGPSITGGGKGVVCRAKDNSIKSVELLDLWEARTIFNRKIVESRAPVAQQVANVAARLKFSMTQSVVMDVPNGPDQTAQEVMLHAKLFLMSKTPLVKRLKGVSLTLTDDSFEIARPENCAIEQIVNYTSGGFDITIYVNEDLYEKMSPTQQAALIIHESFYRYLRDAAHDKDSVRTRRTVGYLFAGGTFPDLTKILLTDHLSCHHVGVGVGQSYAYLFVGKNGSLQGVRAYSGYDNIGYFPVSAAGDFIDASNWKSYFSGERCSKTTATSLLDMVILNGAGPADYDSSSAVQLYCVDGKLKITFSQLEPNVIDHGPDNPELICE